MKALFIDAEGKWDVRDIPLDSYPVISGFIGGYLEPLALASHDSTQSAFMYLNEDGKSLSLPMNPLADWLARSFSGMHPWDFIAGPVIIFGSPDAYGNETDVPEWIVRECERK